MRNIKNNLENMWSNLSLEKMENKAEKINEYGFRKKKKSTRIRAKQILCYREGD